MPITVRPATPADTHTLALLLNSGQEPHFHTTAAHLNATLARTAGHRLISEQDGQLTGSLSLSFPDFHPQHVWVNLCTHPDHRDHGTARALLDAARPAITASGRTRLWTSVRADYLGTGPDLEALGFREVHRTFGGGFRMTDAAHPPTPADRLEARLAQAGVQLRPAAPLRHDPRLAALYAAHHADKVTAEPTIPAASPTHDDPDTLWDAGWVAVRGEDTAAPDVVGLDVVGLALPERSRLDAWNAVLLVRPGERRQGIGTALQARVCASLHAQGLTFLNTAGVGRDHAYLGVLRRLGADIEPAWLAFEATP